MTYTPCKIMITQIIVNLVAPCKCILEERREEKKEKRREKREKRREKQKYDKKYNISS